MAKLEGLGERVYFSVDTKKLSPQAAKKLERDGEKGISKKDLTLALDVFETSDERIIPLITATDEAEVARGNAELEKPMGPFAMLFWMMVPIFGWIWIAIKRNNTEEGYQKAKAEAAVKRDAVRIALEKLPT